VHWQERITFAKFAAALKVDACPIIESPNSKS
jgi:hypothetical protein